MPTKPCLLIKWLALSVLVLLGAASPFALAQTTFGPTTGDAATGATLYAACTSCHGASGTSNIPIRNAANAGRVINLAMARGMGMFNAGSYNDTEENDLAAHIATFFSSPNPSGQAVTFNSLGTAISLPNIYLASAFGGFSGVVAVSAPARGSVSAADTEF